MIVQHFIGLNGFEACIEENQRKYRVGWKGPKAEKFTFVCCKFEKSGKGNRRGWGYEANQRVGFKFSIMDKERERIHTWTTYSAASKRFIEMVKNHNKVKFK